MGKAVNISTKPAEEREKAKTLFGLILRLSKNIPKSPKDKLVAIALEETRRIFVGDNPNSRAEYFRSYRRKKGLVKHD